MSMTKLHGCISHVLCASMAHCRGAKCSVSVLPAHARPAYSDRGPAVHPLAITQVPVRAPAPRVHDALVTEA